MRSSTGQRSTFRDTLVRHLPGRGFPGSGDYWESRYAEGHTSGVGSYGVLAEYKAAFLNDFVRREGLTSVLEFGTGDGNQLSLADYPSYTGLDVSPTAIDLCLERFGDDPTKSFFRYDSLRFRDPQGRFRADLTLSLDVVYHLIEEPIFDAYMSQLFAAATRFVIIYSTNEQITDPGGHVLHRRFTPWVESRAQEWQLVQHEPNPHRDEFGGWADFHVFARRD